MDMLTFAAVLALAMLVFYVLGNLTAYLLDRSY